MDYSKHYTALVNRAKDRVLSGYKERHHIVPRCLGGCDNEPNIAVLTAEEHYLAHQLLVKIHKGHRGLIYSALMMTAPRDMSRRPNNKVYGWLRRKCSSARLGMTFSDEHKANLAKARLGKPMTPEAKANLSRSLSGRVRTEEHCRNLSESLKGRRPSQQAIEASVAWRKENPVSDATRAKFSKSAKGRTHTADAKAKIAEAVKLQHQREREEGISRCTEETRAKLSKALKGKIVSEETRRRLSENKKAYYAAKRQSSGSH